MSILYLRKSRVSAAEASRVGARNLGCVRDQRILSPRATARRILFSYRGSVPRPRCHRPRISSSHPPPISCCPSASRLTLVNPEPRRAIATADTSDIIILYSECSDGTERANGHERAGPIRECSSVRQARIEYHFFFPYDRMHEYAPRTFISDLLELMINILNIMIKEQCTSSASNALSFVVLKFVFFFQCRTKGIYRWLNEIKFRDRSIYLIIDIKQIIVGGILMPSQLFFSEQRI